jgi:hypothetical protein
VLSYQPGGANDSDASKVNVVPGSDPDLFVLSTDITLYNKAVRLGFNAVYQSANVNDDGSLSVYCVRHGIRYLNVEARNGDSISQRRLLMAILG